MNYCALLLTLSSQAALLGLRLGLPTPHTPLLSPAGKPRRPAHPLLSVPGVQVATTLALADPVALAAGRAATASVPSAQAVRAMAGDLGLPGLPATGLQAHGPVGGVAAPAPVALGRAGPATAPKLLGLLGVDVRPALPLLLLSPLLSPLDRLLVCRPALAMAFVWLLHPWTPLQLLLEATAPPAKAQLLSPPPWPAQLLLPSVFSVLLSCFKRL